MAPEPISLPADPRAAGLARAVVRDRLRAWGMDDLVDVVALLSSELVTNALLHTSSSPRLQVTREGDDVRVTVVDSSPAAPLRRQHGRTAMTGRGLELLEKLADDWGWTTDDRGKVVWVLVRGTPGPDRLSPGRGDEPERSPGGKDWITACLLGVPVRVYVAARDHQEGLLREFRLLAMSGVRDGAPPGLATLTELYGVRLATAGRRPEVEAAFAAGVDRVDLEFSVLPSAVADARQLESFLEEADELCRAGVLVSVARTPVVRDFSRWYLEQLVDQAAGGSPSPWPGPLDPA